MNFSKLTVWISTLASTIAAKLSDEELGLLAAILTQLGDTLNTILTQRIFLNRK
jgi:hypothetical protein